ncbi:thioesterase II family protein [Streptomyces globisporus]|uniref:thioesterase II family protein n=1 Tax=Streptomyces globisporus TaxID=1908 RepID=UPI00068DC4EE|nr:alpha/beta fold hydrolase [Streptomyces globisporus]
MTGASVGSGTTVPARRGPLPGRTPGQGPARSAYLLPRQPDPTRAPLRLFCFHHAGGAASSFSGWQERLGGAVAVVPVQLPGREHRVKEPRLREFARLVEELDEALDPLLDAPYAFYGHSMGGIVAHELTRRRVERGLTPPRQLLVGACPPPHRPHLNDGVPPQRRTDEELTAWMAGLGGLPELVRRYPEWLRLAVAVLRDDLSLVHSHSSGPDAAAAPDPLPVPIRALAGSSDPLVTPRLAAEWARHTTADFRVFTLAGGHFFHRSAPGIVLRLVASLLAAEHTARS